MQADLNNNTLVTPDFSQVQDQVGPGIYKVRVVDSKPDAYPGKDGKPPTNIIVWTMETFDEADDKNNGRRIFHRTPIEGAFASRLLAFYAAAMHEACAGAFDRTMLHGRELQVTMGAQKNDPQYNEVKAVAPLTH